MAASGSDSAPVARRELDRVIRVNEYVEWDNAPTYVQHGHRAASFL